MTDSELDLEDTDGGESGKSAMKFNLHCCDQAERLMRVRLC